MLENIVFLSAYLLYLLSLVTVVYVSFRSRNDIVTVFGILYGIYSLGFLQSSFVFEYFTAFVNVTFSVADYLRLFALNCLVTLVFVLSDSSRSVKSTNARYNRIIGLAFLILGLIALLNELRFYGFSDFLLSDKALRFSGEFGNVTNLFIVSIDYHVFIIAGSYALAVDAQQKWKRGFFVALLLTSALVGFLQGYRYYLAAIFLFVFLVLAKRRFRSSLWVVMPLAMAGLFLAEFSKILLSWIKYYEWVRGWGFLNYVAMNYSGLVPEEVQAIATNTYLGFSVYAGQLRPDILGYLVKTIPFSERFYDFSSFDRLYSVLGIDLGLDAGQGTAFSFFLDCYVSYFLPLLALFLVLKLTRIHPAPIVKVIALFFALNLIRNGFLVSISVLKLPLLIYGASYLLLSIVLLIGSVPRSKRSVSSSIEIRTVKMGQDNVPNESCENSTAPFIRQK